VPSGKLVSDVRLFHVAIQEVCMSLSSVTM
jgi:hypothetical protein